MTNKEIDELIKPFFWVERENSAYVCLNVGAYKTEIFDSRAAEGFEGDYD